LVGVGGKYLELRSELQPLRIKIGLIQLYQASYGEYAVNRALIIKLDIKERIDSY